MLDYKDAERAVLAALPANLAIIQRHTGLKRPTLNLILNRLTSCGLITGEHVYRNGFVYSANPNPPPQPEPTDEDILSRLPTLATELYSEFGPIWDRLMDLEGRGLVKKNWSNTFATEFHRT